MIVGKYRLSIRTMLWINSYATKSFQRRWLAIEIQILSQEKSMPARTWYVDPWHATLACTKLSTAILAVRAATDVGLELHQTQRCCSLSAHFQYRSDKDRELEYHCHDVHNKRLGDRVLLQFSIYLWHNACKLLDKRKNWKGPLRGDSKAPSCICGVRCHSWYPCTIDGCSNGAKRPSRKID